MNFLVDTHCHLDLFQGIQENPLMENISGIKTISVTNAPSFFSPNKKLFEGSDNIRIALGMHPQLVAQYAEELGLFEKLIDSTKYVGEIGLDGSSDLKNSYSLQMNVFANILICIKNKGKKILTIHSRNAAKETIELLSKNLKNTDNRVILHWFTGNKSDLDEGVKNNFYFSINHKMVNTEKGKDIIRKIPDHLLLTETDAPFTFHAGIKERVRSIENTLQSIAAIKGKSKEEYQNLIFRNFKQMISF
jgi:TatD DNase family protein